MNSRLHVPLSLRVMCFNSHFFSGVQVYYTVFKLTFDYDFKKNPFSPFFNAEVKQLETVSEIEKC